MSDQSRRARRHSPAVYRRRRLGVLALALGIIGLLVWLFVAQPWRSDATPTPSPPETEAASTTAPTPPAASDGPEPSETPTPQTPPAEPEIGPCDPANVSVVAVASQASYGPDEQPAFSIELTNTGEIGCEMNVGTATQRFVVMSGNDTWWRSEDCATGTSDAEGLIPPGETVASEEPIVWDRTRSSAETCDAEQRPAAPGGGATYRLDVEIGGITSDEPVTFTLT